MYLRPLPPIMLMETHEMGRMELGPQRTELMVPTDQAL